MTTMSSVAATGDAWLIGMAGVHQQCDLSVRRMLTDTGQPFADGRVAANSLNDLSKPHNRFAHVRIPNNILIGTGTALAPTSMPVLALSKPASILDAMNNTMVDVAPPDSPNTGPVVTPNLLSGFLRPEFVLGLDTSHLENPTDGWGEERLGEDLLTSNALGFDVQVFDPFASFFTTDSGMVVGPNDPSYRDAVNNAETSTSALALADSVDGTIARTQGGFVDLAYPVLAGGSLRGWQSRLTDRRSTAVTGPINAPGSAYDRLFLITPFSGLRRYTAAPPPPTTVPALTSQNAYQTSLFRSGRLVTQGNTIRLFQPAFDTYTSFYEFDGIAQLSSGGSGTMWGLVSATADNGTDGVDDNGTINAYYGADDEGERETLPPFIAHPEAIRITVRIENPSTRQIRQSSVVHRDQL